MKVLLRQFFFFLRDVMYCFDPNVSFFWQLLVNTCGSTAGRAGPSLILNVISESFFFFVGVFFL